MKSANPISVQAGKVEFLKVNAVRWDWRDTYHSILNLRWPWFFLVLLGVYLVINLTFATLYCLGPASIDGMPPGSFPSAFFFSVETLATVGYGHMYPATLYGHVVATLEIMLGMFGMAVITGLIFVRFSRPTARFVFSQTLTVAPFDGKPTIALRVANLRHQPMVEAEFRLMFTRNETVQEGDVFRRFYPLRLQVERMISFPAAMTLRHVIDEQSPLHGMMTAEALEQCESRFIASIVCVDTVIPASVQSHQDYTWRDVRFGHRFVEIYTDLPDGRFIVDYGRVHETEPAPGGIGHQC